jgi:hypothetical protein
LIFSNQRWGESNAVLSLIGLDVVNMYMIREESKVSFFRVRKSDISSWNMNDGLQIAMYYSRVFGMFGQKSHSHFLYASSLESYPMKPNMGLVRIYRLMHVIGILRAALGGGDYEEEKQSGCS